MITECLIMIKKLILIIFLVLFAGNLNAEAKTYKMVFVPASEKGEESDYTTLISITEKPEITYNINSGMYILEPHLLDEIPDNKFFHITQLIENIQNRNGKIGVFPVSEKSWIDIGDWKKYIEEINVI